MKNKPNLPRHNLGLYRLDNFVGRTTELAQLQNWLDNNPVVAISGPSGAGKSTLATALAVNQAARFDEGIVWISATGATGFDFYDIVRDIEDVLATGITSRPVSSWPILILQQLYGFKRLLIMDELTDADAEAIENIVNLIRQIGPGGQGRFVLIGRTIPQPLLDLVGKAHLKLGGVSEQAVGKWIEHHQTTYPLTQNDAALLHKLTGGHPLALKLVAGLWNTTDWAQFIELISVQEAGNWDARLKATVTAALARVNRKSPAASQLLTRCSQASGGFSTGAIKRLHWRDSSGDLSLEAAVQKLIRLGLLMYNLQDHRYSIHPLVRRYLNVASYAGLTAAQQQQYKLEYAKCYLTAAQRFARTSPDQWYKYDADWGNIRKALNFLAASLETEIGIQIDHALTAGNFDALRDSSLSIDNIVILIKHYVVTLRTYLLWRHPPEGRRWLAAGIIAGRFLLDRQTEALLSKSLAALLYFHYDYNAAQMWYRRSLPFFKEAKDYQRVILVMKNLATVLRGMGNLEEALEAYFEALHLAQKYHYHLAQSTIQLAIGSIYYFNKDYQQAVARHKKALTLDQAQGSPIRQAIHYNNLGLAFESLNKYDKAINAYKQAIELHQRCSNQKGLSTTYGNMGAAYYKLGQLEDALRYYEKDMTIRNNLGNWLDIAAISHNMGHIALESNNISAATNYFTRSRNLYLEFGQRDLAEEEQLLLNTLSDRRVKRE